MNKQNFKAIVSKAVLVAKVTALLVIVALTVVGGYVVTNGTLRNQVIDFAQGQQTVQAESPKAN